MPMSSRILLAFLTALAVIAQATAARASGAPGQRHTPHDMSLASSALLKVGDLSAGWSATSSPSNPNSPTCDAVLAPRESNLVQTGRAVSRIFTGRGGSDAVGQSVQLFATQAQASAAWKQTVTKKLIICMEQELENSSTMSSPVSVTSWSRLALPHSASRFAGYRVLATGKTSKNKTITLSFDLLLLARARTVTTVSLTSIGAPIKAALERQLAHALSQRLAPGG
jgi:hypothetical protein